MKPDIIVLALYLAPVVVLSWLAMRWTWANAMRRWRRHPEPETHVDQGGFPPHLFPKTPPEDDSGLRAGDGRPSIYREW